MFRFHILGDFKGQRKEWILVVHALGVNIAVLHEWKFELPEGVDDDNVGEAVIPSISSLCQKTLIFFRMVYYSLTARGEQTE